MLRPDLSIVNIDSINYKEGVDRPGPAETARGSPEIRGREAPAGAPAGPWQSAAEAAGCLGIKVETLYAYVSRGMLTSHRAPGERRSRFERAEVERLAARARGPRRSRELDLVVDSALTLIEPEGALYYRGHDATAMARTARYEQVAEWLWTGRWSDPPTWRPEERTLAVAGAVQNALPAAVQVVDRIRASAAVAGSADPFRDDRRPESILLTGRSLISVLVDALPPIGHEQDAFQRSAPLGVPPPADASIAARLWPRLSAEPARTAQVAALDAALVLLADHELAASTLAARIAASVQANPYLVVTTGLGPVGGALHGGASEDVRIMLREVEAGASPAEVLGRRLAEGGIVPGLGHAVYRGTDPRFSALLEVLREGSDWADGRRGGSAIEALEGLLAAARERSLPAPNVDMALGALVHRSRMRQGAGEAMFAVARCAGWLAHAIEEYGHRMRYRIRAAYTGPAPGSPASR